MRLFFILIFINFFYENVSQSSIFVKISWRENGEHNRKYYKQLENMQTERFNLELTGNNTGYIFNGRTDKYDTFHFVENYFFGGNIGELFTLKVFNNVINEIALIKDIQINTIIYIIVYQNTLKNIKIFKNEEEQFEQIINLLKYPVHILQFKIIIKVPPEIPIQIKCTIDGESNFNASFDKKKSSVWKTEHIKSKICPNNLYTLFTYKINEKNEIIGINETNLNCNSATHLNEYINYYEIKLFPTNCILGGYSHKAKNPIILLTEDEKIAQEKITNYEEITKSNNNSEQSQFEPQVELISNQQNHYQGIVAPQEQQQNVHHDQFYQNINPYHPFQMDYPQNSSFGHDTPYGFTVTTGKNALPSPSRKRNRGKKIAKANNNTETPQLQGMFGQQKQTFGQGWEESSHIIPVHQQSQYNNVGDYPYKSDYLTSKQLTQQLAADRWNNDQTGQPLLQNVNQPTLQGTSSTHPDENVSTDLALATGSSSQYHSDQQQQNPHLYQFFLPSDDDPYSNYQNYHGND